MGYDLLIVGNGAEAPAAARQAVRMGQWTAWAPNVLRETWMPPKNLSSSVEVIPGSAEFLSSDCVKVTDGGLVTEVSASRILLACETSPIRPRHLQFDGLRILDADEALTQPAPETALVVGAGESGLTAAIRWADLGSAITVVDEKTSFDEVITGPRTAQLLIAAREIGVTFRMGCEVIGADIESQRTTIFCRDDSQFHTDVAVFAMGRRGRADELRVERAGLMTDDRGRIWCDADGQTWEPGIFAVGGCVGFPERLRENANAGREMVKHIVQMTALPLEI